MPYHAVYIPIIHGLYDKTASNRSLCFWYPAGRYNLTKFCFHAMVFIFTDFTSSITLFQDVKVGSQAFCLSGKERSEKLYYQKDDKSPEQQIDYKS